MKIIFDENRRAAAELESPQQHSTNISHFSTILNYHIVYDVSF